MAKVKGILLSLIAILLVSGMMGVAYAKSDGINKQNHFSHNGVDLKLIDQDELSWQDGVSATWVVTNMAPGVECHFVDDEPFVGLASKSSGSVNITCDYTVEEKFPQTEADTDWETDLCPGPDDMATYMEITRCTYEFTYKKKVWQINCLTGKLTIISGNKKHHHDGYIDNDEWQIQDKDGDGEITFYDLNQGPLTNLPLLRKGKGARFEMSVKFHQDAGNEFQGDTFNLTMIYTLEPGIDWEKELSKYR